MAEARDPFAAAQALAHHGGGEGQVGGLGEHHLDAQGGAAVQGATGDAETGGDNGVGVGADGRRDPGGEGRRGQLVVGKQHHREAQHVGEGRVRAGCGELLPQPPRDRAPVRDSPRHP